MSRAAATASAASEAIKSNTVMAVVAEGPHADEFAEFDDDGESYGFCPLLATRILYRHGNITEVIYP